jgi:hypothetical protein
LWLPTHPDAEQVAVNLPPVERRAVGVAGDLGQAVAPVVEGGDVFYLGQVTRGLFEVRIDAGHKPPQNAYVPVCYRGTGFTSTTATRPRPR